jgi:uncharacterized protein (TIGR04255 family)
MTVTGFRLANAPIVEAVLDINCDFPPATDLLALEGRAREAFGDKYPKAGRRLIGHVEVRHESNSPTMESSFEESVGALQFATLDGKQLVQVRREGFSFNRLAPYSSLDDYLEEIERTWLKFVELVKPVQIQRIGLRYFNRILLPAEDNRVDFDAYLRVAPKILDDKLSLAGFIHQYTTVETASGNQVNITLFMQPQEEKTVPLILDIDAFRLRAHLPEEWGEILRDILALRELKNRVFRNSLTEECLNLFQQH